MREIVLPTLEGFATDGLDYRGFLYVGLMIDKSGAPKVLEYNCRLGDPETQVILLRLKSDLFDLLEAALGAGISGLDVEWDRRTALAVVFASAGYPQSARKGDVIRTLPADADDLHVFHAGTQRHNGDVVTNGGRVLAVTALGDSTAMAQRRAYAAAAEVAFDGMVFRRDIGHHAVGRRRSARTPR